MMLAERCSHFCVSSLRSIHHLWEVSDADSELGLQVLSWTVGPLCFCGHLVRLALSVVSIGFTAFSELNRGPVLCPAAGLDLGPCRGLHRLGRLGAHAGESTPNPPAQRSNPPSDQACGFADVRVPAAARCPLPAAAVACDRLLKQQPMADSCICSVMQPSLSFDDYEPPPAPDYA